MKPAFSIARAALLPVAAVLALAACQQDTTKDAGAARKAQGEILEGSISDAMLPHDTVRSQPPLVPRADTTPKGEGGSGEKAADAASPAAAAAAGTPAAIPSAAADPVVAE